MAGWSRWSAWARGPRGRWLGLICGLVAGSIEIASASLQGASAGGWLGVGLGSAVVVLTAVYFFPWQTTKRGTAPPWLGIR